MSFEFFFFFRLECFSRQTAIHDKEADFDAPNQKNLELLHHYDYFRAIFPQRDVLGRKINFVDILDEVRGRICENFHSDRHNCQCDLSTDQTRFFEISYHWSRSLPRKVP